MTKSCDSDFVHIYKDFNVTIGVSLLFREAGIISKE